MSDLRSGLCSLCVGLFLLAPSARAEGPFVGVDLGISEPTNGNYRAHVRTGATGNPFAGYMFDDYLGLQGQLHFTLQTPDDHHWGTRREDQTTSLFGATVGPRLALPLSDLFEVYGVAQGGYFTGLSGRWTHGGAGFSVGPGIDMNLDRNLAVGLFGRWNRAYVSPRPTDLGPLQVGSERHGEDAQWLTAGFGVKYTFARPEAPAAPAVEPPSAPTPIAAPPPIKKRFVLRNVHFDFDKSNLRPDSLPVLDEAVEILMQEAAVHVVVEGHTDWIGTAEYNLKLSERRAESVRRYLVAHGIAASRLRSVGMGKSQPVATNETADGRAQNRRVELRVEEQ